MITTNYQVYGKSEFNLRLRVYQNGETRYVCVNKLLQGKLNKCHWNQKKQLFVSSAPFSEENNEALVQFKRKYDEKAINWSGSVFNFILSFNEDPETNEAPLMVKLIADIITEMKGHKHADGTVKGTYECYVKLQCRLIEFCAFKKIDWDRLLVKDFSADFVNSIFDWIDKRRGGKGKLYVSKTLHAVLVRAEKMELVDMAQYKSVSWVKKSRVSEHKYYTLTTDQCNKLVALSGKELPKNSKKFLYRDFCVFLLFTGLSPCDAIALKHSDIERIDGVDHFVFKRRKIAQKQSVPCAVPINSIMQQIIDKWKTKAKDGYIFPIRSKQKLATQITDNGDIKHFVGRLNHWLKKLGMVLGCNFPLHTYTFRHTAITNYISKGVPVIYVANMMGTSVENCEKIYYNNRGDVASRNKVLGLTAF